MNAGKQTCETLKDLRLQIAKNNDIDYHPTQCNHKGECAGTCPACESEVRYIEDQLALRKAAGKAIKIFGVMATMTMMASCKPLAPTDGPIRGKVPAEVEENQPSQNPKETEGEPEPEIYKLEGDVPKLIEEDEEEGKDTEK